MMNHPPTTKIRSVRRSLCPIGTGGLFGLVVLMMIGGCSPTSTPNGNGMGGNANDNQNDNSGGGGNENTNTNNNENANGSTTPKSIFACVGDYGDDDDNSRAVADMIKSWSPDYIITVGDNDYSDGAFRGTFDALELAVGQYFHEFIGNYQGDYGAGSDVNRFFPTPGDHDWGDTCDDPAGLDDYLAYFTLPGGNSGNERYYDFRQGDIHFFSVHAILDCEPDGATADSVQAQWVQATAQASDAPVKIAYFHKPAYSSADQHIGEGEHMRWPWGDWGFALAMSGDDHVYERLEIDGVTYVTNGLGGLDIHGFVDPPVAGSQVRFADDYGAMRFDVFDDRIEASFITVGGTVVDTFTIDVPGGSTDTGGMLDPNVAPITVGNWYRPDTGTTWQWQLQPGAGGINTTYDVAVYDVDLFDAPQSLIDDLQADGRRVICYFSAGSYEDFRDDANEFLPADLGSPLDGFADERWLDIRSTNVHRIMQERLDMAAAKGCDGVEPDNVDGYQNASGFDLTATDQLAFNRFLANEAHTRGLAVALKNDLDQIPDLVVYFDFSVNEQCHEFDECDALQPFIDAGKPVFNAEYADGFVNDASVRDDLCTAALGQNLRALVLPLDLDDSFRFSCD